MPKLPATKISRGQLAPPIRMRSVNNAPILDGILGINIDGNRGLRIKPHPYSSVPPLR